MTTFHDPQPQSRRAVRQSERGQAGQEVGSESSAAFTDAAASPAPQTYPAAPKFSEADASGDMWDTTARRAAQLPQATPAPVSDAAPAPSGRRSAAPQPSAGAEPLTYSTQSRPLTPAPAQPTSSVPSYDGPSFRPRSSASRADAAPASSEALPPTQAMPRVEQPAYRVRDFSPEGRRAAPAAAASWNAPAAPEAASSSLEYHTEGRLAPVTPITGGPVRSTPISPVPEAEAAPVAPAPVAPVPVAPAPAAPSPEPVALVEPELHHTFTRRELRAQQAGLAQSPSADVPVAEVPVAPAAPAPAAPAPAAQAEPVATDEAAAWPFGDLFAAPAPAAPAPAAHAPAAPSLPPVAPEPTPTTALTNAIAEFDSLTQAPAPQVPAAPAVQPSAPQPGEPQLLGGREVEEPPASQWTPPVGHWSMQAGLDDETQPYESTINRTIGSGSVTTNALVLPSIPEGSDIRGPLTGTGEIMLTGSIDLPHAFSSTGATARVEATGIDALFDMHDAEIVTTDSQPVRAISAVSTHTSGQSVTHTQKPKGTRALTALVIAAASMAVVVVGLLVAVFALRIF